MAMVVFLDCWSPGSASVPTKPGTKAEDRSYHPEGGPLLPDPSLVSSAGRRDARSETRWTSRPTRPRQATRFGNWPIPLLCLLLGVQILLTIGAGRRDDLSWFDPIIDIRAMVLEDHVGEPDSGLMQQAAIDAMLEETLDDPYTVWIPARLENDFDKQMRGTYVGIGAEIDLEADRLRIISPLEDSPPSRRGSGPGTSSCPSTAPTPSGLGTDECIELLMGEEGVPVQLVVRRRDGARRTR